MLGEIPNLGYEYLQVLPLVQLEGARALVLGVGLLLERLDRVSVGIFAGVLGVNVLENLKGGVGLAALEQELWTLGEGEQPQSENERGNRAYGDEEIPRLEGEVLGCVGQVQGDDSPRYNCKYKAVFKIWVFLGTSS